MTQYFASDLNVKPNQGNTPLYIIADSKKPQIMQILTGKDSVTIFIIMPVKYHIR